MRRVRLLPLIVTLAASVAVHAHAHLQSATPREGSVLASAPGELVLQFSEPARLTVLWLTHSGGERHKLTGLPQDPQTRITVALPKLSPGEYLLEWRVLGGDGHVVPGTLHFTLKP
jgi:methionine-rich copper-binding protein CopC